MGDGQASDGDAEQSDAAMHVRGGNTVSAFGVSQCPIVDLVTMHGSVRLKNVICQAVSKGKLSSWTIGEYLAAPEVAEEIFFRLPGMGRTCMRELNQLITAPPTQEQLVSMSASQITEPNGSTDLTLPGICNLNDLLQHVSSQHREIVALYYGLADGRGLTLQAIGDRFQVTRERIRQIKARALTTLSRKFGEMARSYLISQTELVWARITSGRLAIRTGSLAEVSQHLTPEERLLIDIGFESVDAWLSAIANKVDLGWVSKDTGTTEIKALHGLLQQIKSPCYLSSLQAQFTETNNPGDLITMIGLSASHMLYGGYVISGSGTKRPRRAVRAHVLLCTHLPRRPMTLPILVKAYREIFLDDQCTARDLQIVMSNAPHLFLNAYEEGWIAIGDGGQLSDLPPLVTENGSDDLGVEVQGDDLSPADPDQISASGSLYELLNTQGPMLFETLREQFMERTNGRFSRASVGPLLISGDAFVRLAPGVYGLTHHLDQPNVLEQAERFLLELHQCKIYCHARWAEEPADLYKLWTPRAENRMVAWARKAELSDLYESLLAIADPTLWLISEEERLRWTHRKMQNGFFHLQESNPFPLTSTLPTMANVTAAAVIARAHNGISWLSVNRSIGARVDDRHTHSILALLIALGVIQAPEHWQQRHVFREESTQLVDRLAEVFHNSDQQRWTVAGISVLLSKANTVTEFGWVNFTELSLLIDELSLLCVKDDVSRPPRSSLSDSTPDELLTLNGLIDLVRRQKAEARALGLVG